MDNTLRSQAKSRVGWEPFLDEAKRRFADARTSEERHSLREAIQGFERLIRRRAKMPKARKSPTRTQPMAGL